MVNPIPQTLNCRTALPTAIDLSSFMYTDLWHSALFSTHSTSIYPS